MKHISTILLVMVLCLSTSVALAQTHPWYTNPDLRDPWEGEIDAPDSSIQPSDSTSSNATYEEQGPNLPSENSGTSSTGGDAQSSLVSVINQFEKIIINLITWISSIAGMIVVIMIIIGGINYLRGDSEGGKKTLLAAIIGTIIILLAIVIVNIFKQLTGS